MLLKRGGLIVLETDGSYWTTVQVKLRHKQWRSSLLSHLCSPDLQRRRSWEEGAQWLMLGFAAAAAKSLQPCLTLCDPIDGSPPGSPIPGILQARALEGLPLPPPCLGLLVVISQAGFVRMSVPTHEKERPRFASSLIIVAQLLSRVWLFVILDHSTPGSSILHSLMEFAQSHVHWVNDAIQQPHLLSSPSPPPSIFPSIRVFSNESAFCIRWPKYWSFSFSISPSNEYSGLISFGTDGFDLLSVQRDSQESSPTLQFKSICSSVLSLLYGPALTPIQYWKNHSFD